ncbi:Type II/IV secretion system protein [uncultured archaeon]|nr:Type II/IV secretion system protein [uncultured archaeon]
MSLGWKLGNWKAEYRVDLPRLSAEEEALVSSVAESFRTETQRKGVSSEDEARALLEKLLLEECDEQGLDIDSEQKGYLSRAAYLQTFGFGFLQELLADEKLEEIAVIGLDRPVFVYVRGDAGAGGKGEGGLGKMRSAAVQKKGGKNGGSSGSGWKRTNVAIDSQDYFVSLVNRLGRNLGRRLTAQQPRLNAVLEGGSRVHASMPPVSGCELTIRKFTREPFSPFSLLSRGTYGARTLSLLSLCIQADLSLVMAGNTASGKTSTLNALLSFVPSSERMLLIEETPEISVPHPHQLRMVPFEESGISMVELVRDSLRMRPDRVVVGEVRGAGEAKAFVESALSGQAKGCYTTFHAQSSRDAMLRLRMMGCMEADLEGIDVFVLQRRVSTYDSGRRKVGEARKVTEIAVANKADVMNPIVVFDGRSFHPKGENLLYGKVSEGTGMPPREVKQEMARREKFLRSHQEARGFSESFALIQKFMFGSAPDG